MEPADYLKRPYGRVVVPEADGSFRGEIMEFPGCISLGDTAADALAKLEDVATSWLAAKIAKNLPVPESMEGTDYSGKLNVRLGRDLHRRAAHIAAHQGVSLNQFIVSGVAERVGMLARPLTVHTQPTQWLNTIILQIGVGHLPQLLAPTNVPGLAHASTLGAIHMPRSQEDAHA